MRKMKKINGYLVVRFNDHEKCLNADTGLGSFGVIDAEQYTGILNIDRGVMEYDSADTLEEAIEQARGLESELDVEEPEVKVTIITETDTESTEQTNIDPVGLFERESKLIKRQAENPGFPYMNGCAAAYHMRGYLSALQVLGLASLDDERFQVDLDEFDGRLPVLLTPRELERIQSVKNLFKEVEQYTSNPVEQIKDYRRCQLGSSFQAEGHTQSHCFFPQNKRAEREKENQEKRVETGFLHPPVSSTVPPIQLYELGMRLLDECPENDCAIYKSVFIMSLEADLQLDRLMDWPRKIVECALNKKYRELERMYLFNEAIKKMRKPVQNNSVE